MKTHGILILTAACFLVACIHPVSAQSAADKELLTGVVYKGTALCWRRVRGQGPIELMYRQVGQGPAKWVVVNSNPLGYPPRWGIKGSVLWLGVAWTMDDAANITYMRYWVDSYNVDHIIDGTAKLDNQRAFPTDDFSLVKDGPLDRGQAYHLVGIPLNLHYDYLALDGDRMRLFLLDKIYPKAGKELEGENRGEDRRQNKSPRPIFEVWDYQAAKSKTDPEKWEKGVWRKAEEIKPLFYEPFHVCAGGSTYFFVTDSGKVYVSSKRPGRSRIVEPLEANPEYRIYACITDSASGKTFAFGRLNKPANSGESELFFELDDHIRVHRFDRKDIERVSAEEPLKTVLECCKALVSARAIKLPVGDR